MNAEDNGELPEGWACAKLADVVEDVPNIKPEAQPNRLFQYVDISSIDNDAHRLTEAKAILGKDAPSRARRPVCPGDVVFSNVRTYLRNIAMIPEGSTADVCSTGFTVLRAGAALDPRYLFRYTLTNEFIDRVTPEQTGTHYPATSDRVVLDQTIPVPPLAEQKRIVAAVEAVLAKVNAARERLNRVPTILKRFRQAVLSAACSGRLTADWQEKKPASETAASLSELPEGELLAASELENLPSDWQLPELESLRDPERGISYGVLKPGEFVENGIPLLRIVDIDTGVARITDAHRISAELSRQYSRTVLRGGEVLVSLVGTIGRVATVPSELRGANIHRNLGLIAPSVRVESHYLAFAMSSEWIQKQIAFVTVGASQPLSVVPNFPVARGGRGR